MKLSRIFNNILKNAAAYGFPNSEIIISAQEQENQEEKLAAIFERFYRLDEARVPMRAGPGLGL